MILYKYRSLKDLYRFLDILLYKRLYMAQYNEMNDPMEGAFWYSTDIPNMTLQTIISEKNAKYICSLSKTYNNTVLWSHYADSHNGCCIEVEVISPLEPYEVQYSSNIPSIISASNNPITILTHKSLYWKYENEVRFFKDVISNNRHNTRPYLPIKINKIYLGYRMSGRDYSFFEKLIKSVDCEIDVVKIKKEELDTGLYIRP